MKVNVIYNVTGRAKSMEKVFADVLVKLNKVRIVDDSVFESTPLVPITPIVAPAPVALPDPLPVSEITPAATVDTTDLFNTAGAGVNEKPKESVAAKPRANNQKSKGTDPEA